jgi:hypothetical protein
MTQAGYSRWLTWKPPIFRKSPEEEPTKPTKGGFEGFVGATSAAGQRIEGGFVGFEGSGSGHLQKIEDGTETSNAGRDSRQLPTSPLDWPPSMLEVLQERAAIKEFEAGMSCADAERQAEAEIRDLWGSQWGKELWGE